MKDSWPFDRGRFDWVGVLLAVALVAAWVAAFHEASMAAKSAVNPLPLQGHSEKT